jgi:hypothetical protein
LKIRAKRKKINFLKSLTEGSIPGPEISSMSWPSPKVLPSEMDQAATRFIRQNVIKE